MYYRNLLDLDATCWTKCTSAVPIREAFRVEDVPAIEFVYLFEFLKLILADNALLSFKFVASVFEFTAFLGKWRCRIDGCCSNSQPQCWQIEEVAKRQNNPSVQDERDAMTG